jgi:hypothetical protein
VLTRIFWAVVALVLVALLGLGLTLEFLDLSEKRISPSKLGKFKTAAVSSGSIQCSKIGRYIDAKLHLKEKCNYSFDFSFLFTV